MSGAIVYSVCHFSLYPFVIFFLCSVVLDAFCDLLSSSILWAFLPEIVMGGFPPSEYYRFSKLSDLGRFSFRLGWEVFPSCSLFRFSSRGPSFM